ncbi:MAG: hypothetical protein AB8U82_00445 [Rickettsia endosymbiont of Haemaphysalis japonica]
MCASGKDREGLNEHNKISQALSKYTGIKRKIDIDKQLLKNCHIAQQAGSIYAGCATIGCYGTKKENKRVIPKSRKETLAVIMALTAKTNKIADKKKMDKKIDAEYEKNHPRESIAIRSDRKVVKPLTKSVSQLKPSITPPKYNPTG